MADSSTGRPYKPSELYKDKILEVTTRIRTMSAYLSEGELKRLVDELEEMAQWVEILGRDEIRQILTDMGRKVG